MALNRDNILNNNMKMITEENKKLKNELEILRLKIMKWKKIIN